MKEITSAKNPQVKAWRQLKTPSGRRAHQRFLAEGEHLSQEAVSAGRAEALIILKGSQERYADALAGGLDCYLVSAEVIRAIADSKTPQDILAICRLKVPEPPGILGRRLVALNQVQDPGNVGTILRTMYAAGNDAMLIDAGCADPFSPKALRASMGAIFHVPVYASPDLSDTLARLKGEGWQLIAGDLSGSPFFGHQPFGEKTCLLVGNEGAGLSPQLLALADLKLKLPMPGGAESLNAAVAGSLLIYGLLRADMLGTENP
ncbi:MAG: RNA methyltransferase [Eubacteriales bacterium]|nr:RNA methyltransferase [Eubacteriales bacterium]